MSLDDLYLNYSGLKQLSEDDINSERYLKAKCLYLKRNLLKVLPHSIGQLTQLVQLHVVSNDLVCLPGEIGSLVCLEVLDVADNNIEELPPSLGQLRRLKRLNVGGNSIVSLPKELGDLRQLTSLGAARNLLTCVPAELCQCESLAVLTLDKNRLTSLPRQLGRLHKLTELSLCGNLLEYIPQCYGSDGMPSLTCLYLDNNPGFAQLTHPFDFLKFKCLGLNGCFLSTDARLCDRFQHIPSTSGPVAVPEEIRHICGDREGGNAVPPLNELALRRVSASIHTEQDIEKLPLPESFKESLRDPTAVCGQCSTNLFMFACVEVFEIYVRHFLPYNRMIPMLRMCCSKKCLKLHFRMILPYHIPP